MRNSSNTFSFSKPVKWLQMIGIVCEECNRCHNPIAMTPVLEGEKIKLKLMHILEDDRSYPIFVGQCLADIWNLTEIKSEQG